MSEMGLKNHDQASFHRIVQGNGKQRTVQRRACMHGKSTYSKHACKHTKMDNGYIFISMKTFSFQSERAGF